MGSGIGHRPCANNPVEVVTFFNHNFVNCKATLILEIKKIYEIKDSISLNDVNSNNKTDKSIAVSEIAQNKHNG